MGKAPAHGRGPAAPAPLANGAACPSCRPPPRRAPSPALRAMPRTGRQRSPLGRTSSALTSEACSAIRGAGVEARCARCPMLLRGWAGR